VRETTLQTLRSGKKEGEEVILQPIVKTMVRQAVPLQPIKIHSEADTYLQPMEEPMSEQVDAQRRL